MLNTACTCEATNHMEFCESCHREFDLLFEGNPLLQPKRAAVGIVTVSQPAKLTPVVNQEKVTDALNFHEEFKQVVAVQSAEPISPVIAAFSKKKQAEQIQIYEPNLLDDSVSPSSIAATLNPAMLTPTPLIAAVTTINVAPADTQINPQQKVKLIAGPRAGLPPRAEPWLLKLVAVLIILNMVVASFIVTGTRLPEFFKTVQG